LALCFALLTSFCRQQQRREILICFLLCRQLFLKISFLNICRLAFFAPTTCRFAICCQQQRGEILICFRSIVKYFRRISFLSAPGDFFKPTRTFQPASLISNYLPLPACSAVISEAHDCSTGFLRRARRSEKLLEGPAFRLHTYRAFGAKRLAPCHIYVAPSSSVGPKDCRLNAQQARCVSWSSLCRPSPWGLRC
jgi:hypothetical protein